MSQNDASKYHSNTEKELHELLLMQRGVRDSLLNTKSSEYECDGSDALSDCLNQINLIEMHLEKFEILLEENPNRFVLFPIHFPDIWQHYKKHMASFWTAEEISLVDDIEQWESEQTKLSNDDKHFIKSILAFFASFDGIVNENLAARFCAEVQIPEARSFYGFQMAMENIHSEVYSLLIDSLIKDQSEKNKLLRAVENYPSIKKMSDWALKWLNSSRPFNQRLIAFACIEGIHFSAPFCSIFWLKKRGLLPGLTFSNELISRDEGLHTEFACILQRMLKYQAEESIALQIVTEAVDLAKSLISEGLKCNLIGMNASEMGKYVECVADRLLVQLNYKKHWKTSNPFNWMDLISAPTFTNFFEKRVAEYSKSQFNKSKISSQNGSMNQERIEVLTEF